MQLHDIFSEDKYSEAYEYAIRNNLLINEIEPDEFGTPRFQLIEEPKPTEKEQNQFELEQLRLWFETEYSKNEQKFRRLRTLNVPCDDGTEPYDALIKLYNDAEVKRKRIQELELLIAEAKELEKQNQIKGEMIDA